VTLGFTLIAPDNAASSAYFPFLAGIANMILFSKFHFLHPLSALSYALLSNINFIFTHRPMLSIPDLFVTSCSSIIASIITDSFRRHGNYVLIFTIAIGIISCLLKEKNAIYRRIKYFALAFLLSQNTLFTRC